MRILMTGFTSRGVGSLKLRHDYVSLSDILGRALRELGHDVDIGRVLPDETLDGYDRALILVYWASSLSSHYIHEASLAMSKMGERAVLYCDDWRAQTLADDIHLHVERPVGWDRHRGRFRKKLWDQLTPAQVEQGRDALLDVIKPLPPYRALLVPQHPWGDIELFHQSTRAHLTVPVVPIDPTPLVPLPEITRPRERSRSWVLATIQEHDRWLQSLGLAWPVTQLGGARKLGGGVNPGRAEMAKVVPEAQVVQAYADSWGMLVPPYASSGSGWWRPRYTFAAHARSAVLPPPADATALGGPFLYSSTQIEQASEHDLRSIADEQAGVQEGYAWTTDELLAALEGVLR